jgi:hypothetical protein
VVPRAGLDAVKRKTSHAPACNRTPAAQPVARLYTDSANFPNMIINIVLVTAILIVVAVVVASRSNWYRRSVDRSACERALFAC